MVAAWGANPAAYVGHSLTLYRNPSTRFGSEQTGGIEISHLSHIDKPLTVALTATRGKRKPFTVKPLAAPVQEPVRDWIADLAAAGNDLAAIAALGNAAITAHANKETLAIIRARHDELKADTQ